MSDGEDSPQSNPNNPNLPADAGDWLADVPPERVAFYQTQAQELLDAHTRLFDAFTQPYPALVRLGDEKLRSAQATGYNILPDADTMPLTTNEQLIFYNNYIGRPEHFGLLLAAMEHEGLITAGDVRFGVKASKVVNTDAWEPESADETVEEIVVNGPTTPDSSVQAQTSKTVETVVMFVPHDETHARNLVGFLLEHAAAEESQAIAGSWAVPDVRATANLNLALAGTEKFILVQANIHRRTDTTAQLLILRQQTRFRGPWRSGQVAVNDDLALYIASSELGVER